LIRVKKTGWNENRLGICRSNTPFCHLSLIVPDHLLQSHPHCPAGLPSQGILRPSRVRTSLLRIIRRDRLVNDLHAALGFDTVFFLHFLYDLPNEFRELANAKFIAIANVDWARFIGVHEGDQAINQVVDVLEGTGLRAVTVNRHILAAQSLDDEVGHYTTIVGVHCDSNQSVDRVTLK
jgi:hypothetical protein